MHIVRDPDSDLLAIAAMPGLEPLAEIVAKYTVGKSDPLSIVIFSAAQWAFGNRSQATSSLADPVRWERVRASAARVGRLLPMRPPTLDQLRHVRDRAGGQLGSELAKAFVPAMRDLVLQVGVLPSGEPRFHWPDRRSTVYGDGTVFKPQSGVTTNPDTNKPEGSRAAPGGKPRIAERFYGKPAKKSEKALSDKQQQEGAGLPVALLGAHGGSHHQGVVVAVGMHFDRDEVGLALRLLKHCADVYQGRIHALVYDRLLSGIHLERMMGWGIVPVVDMRNAPGNVQHRKVKSRQLQNLLSTGATPIERAVLAPLETVTHIGPHGQCSHDLWALNGTIITPPVAQTDDERRRLRVELAGEADEFGFHVVEQTHLWPETDGSGNHRFFGRYRIPCRSGWVSHELELTGKRFTRTGEGPMVDVVRPIDCTAHASDIRGWRSDVENTFGSFKRKLERHGRASSLAPDDFLVDVVGAALHKNAIAWDVHAAQHTNAGAREYEQQARKRHQLSEARRTKGVRARLGIDSWAHLARTVHHAS